MASYSRFEQARINQLLSAYSPQESPRLSLDFGDYLSLIWRLDHCAEKPKRASYYRACLSALAQALEIQDSTLHKLVKTTEPGTIYTQITNLPYRSGSRLLDAQDRKAAIAKLVQIRDSICALGASQKGWQVSYPGAGIMDVDLRERVFAVLFTAFQGQFSSFARLLLVSDIVLASLLIGYDVVQDISLHDLVIRFGYPDPESERAQSEYDADDISRRMPS